MEDNEVSLNLEKLANELNSKYLYPAMVKACAIVRNDAIQLAPHGTGALQRSIDFAVSDDGTEGVIYSNMDYAPYVEVGTGVYATVGQGRDTPWSYPYYEKGEMKWAKTRGMAPKPYMEPALTQNTTKIRECFEGLLDEKI